MDDSTELTANCETLDPESLDDLMPVSDTVEAAAAAYVAERIAAPLRIDPSAPPGYPRGFVLDLVLKTAPVADLLVAYKLSVDEFRRLTQHPVFIQDLRDTKARLREDGFSFKMKLQAQAEVYLAEAFRLVHDRETPANVKSDLIKWSVKASGLEAPPITQASPQESLAQAAETLKNLPQGELEMRMMSIILKKGANQPTAPTPIAASGVTYDASA